MWGGKWSRGNPFNWLRDRFRVRLQSSIRSLQIANLCLGVGRRVCIKADWRKAFSGRKGRISRDWDFQIYTWKAIRSERNFSFIVTSYSYSYSYSRGLYYGLFGSLITDNSGELTFKEHFKRSTGRFTKLRMYTCIYSLFEPFKEEEVLIKKFLNLFIS